MQTYEEIIAAKLNRPRTMGFEPHRPLHKGLFEWQRLLVDWAVRRGRAALFCECGLGKTFMQLEWASLVSEHAALKDHPRSVLILAPLEVVNQTVEEGAKFGYAVNRCREPEDVRPGINITNYDRAAKFDMSMFVGVVLDESSILKSLTGKTRQFLTLACAETPYRLCCTATPAPNDHIEFGQHAEFLGVLGQMEMLATWFVNDTADTGTWRLKGHARKDFWRWMSTWAACVTKPSDLGFSDDGFALPDLTITPVWVEVNEAIDAGEGELFRNVSLSATTINAEMRRSIVERAKMVKTLVEQSRVDGAIPKWIVWCNLNCEQDALEEAIGDLCVSVRGADKEEDKISREQEWRKGPVPVMVSKAALYGHGMNWQHCHHVAYFPTYSFEDFHQAIRRTYRFGQQHAVQCHVILPRTASNVLQTINLKMEQFETMREEMKFAADALTVDAKAMLTANDRIAKATGEGWTMYHGDCVRVARLLDDDSIDFSVFSPPFANLFVYSDDAQDMGNCANEDEFGEQFRFLVKEHQRITKPGRLCAIHCLDLMSAKWKDGEIELKDFSGRIVNWYRDEGWLFHSRITIWKDPVTEMQRTKALGLLHKQLLKDSSMSRVGSPEYILVFRKQGVNANPISHTKADYPVEQWQKDASPVWMDIRQERTLNGQMARESQDERHICPLQLDVIERCLRLWSNPGDLVYSPFAGIGSEGHCAVKMGRRFVGSELKASYFKHACEYLKAAVAESADLFSLSSH